LSVKKGAGVGEKLQDLEAKRKKVRERLTEIGDMRQGTLTERFRKCGKPGCKCAENETYSHGPSFSLTKSVKKKTVTRIIPKEAVELTKEQISRFQEFRRLSQEYLAVNEEICEVKLSKPGEVNDRDQKKTSKRSSKPK
jgi:hypothetical protein